MTERRVAHDVEHVGAPSDITSHESPSVAGERATVGGRILVDADGTIFLTDAFARIELALRSGSPALASGDLVRVEGEIVGGGLVDVSVLSTRGGRVTSSGDVARLRDAGIGHALRDRARALEAVRAYFQSERFVEVETPCLVPSPGLDRHLDAFEIAGEPPQRYLITSPEYQMKRLLTGGVPRCFQIAKCFRRAEIGGHHNPEFSMLEWYRAFVGMDAILRDTEEIVRAVARTLGHEHELWMGARRVSLDGPFERLTVSQAFRDQAGIGEAEMLALATNDEEAFFRILIDQVEPWLQERPTPVVLHRYPAKMASLARLSSDDPRFADRFEVYAGGLELSNGFVELTDAREQRARLERDRAERRAAGQAVYPIDERFVAALEEGLPDCAGNALGLDRLIMLSSGRGRIADVLAFPESVL